MRDETTPRRNDHWRCPLCDRRLTSHVRLSFPPACWDPERHSRRVVDMVRDDMVRDDTAGS